MPGRLLCATVRLGARLPNKSEQVSTSGASGASGGHIMSRRTALLALLAGPTVAAVAACSAELGPTPPERRDETNIIRQPVFN